MNRQMKFFRLLSILAVSVLCMASVSCKKEEEEETKEYLSGKISISFPSYVSPGTTKSFKIDTMSTLYRGGDEGKAIGYYFSNPTTGQKDTIVFDGGVPNPKYPGGVYTFKAPTKLGQFSLLVYGYSADYYATSATASFYVVDPRMDGKGSIKGFSIFDEDGVFIDTRDARRYYTTKAAGLEWSRQNLSWKGAGIPYASSESMSSILGRFYTWEEAQTACPAGWRLPSDDEFAALAQQAGGTFAAGSYDIENAAGAFMEDMTFNDQTMWEYWPAVRKTNSLRFSAIPSGYATLGQNKPSFTGYSSYSAFWTSSESDDMGIYRYIYVDKNTVFQGKGDRNSLALSVRCVR